MAVVRLANLHKALQHQSQVDVAAAAAATAAYNSVLAARGYSPSQSGIPADVATEASTAAETARQAAVTQAAAAGLSNEPGSAIQPGAVPGVAAASTEAPTSSVAGFSIPPKWKVAGEIAVGVLGLLIIAKLVSPKRP